jgi:hypothetical protein
MKVNDPRCALFLGAIFLSLSEPIFADSRTVPALELGGQFYSGVEGKSLRGATAYSVYFRSEEDRGRVRGVVAARFEYSTGTASVNSSDLAYTMYGGSFDPGYSLYFFRAGYIQPFLTGSGVIGWNFLNLTSPPTGTEPYTQGFSYGYELSTGVDIRFRRSGGKALRIKCAYNTLYGQIAGLTGFQLSGVKFILGLVF